MLTTAVRAQTPFNTDDADVTERHRFHLEISNQQAWLQRSALPLTQQNTTVVQVNFGLTQNFEIGFDAPWIFLHQQEAPGIAGIGDMNVTFKLRVRAESEFSGLPAMTLACALETPTGSVRKQLGSGVEDFGCNSVLQKTLGEWTLRVNNGVVFSGNTLTGVIGIRSRGLVYLGAASLTRQVHPRLLLGIELDGDAARKATDLGKAIFQTQFGGKFSLDQRSTLDFGLSRGWFSGAPKVQLVAGISVDF